MRCDVVAVGTELLLGQIVDTNSAWIGEQLAAHGIDSLVQVKVGDNLGRIGRRCAVLVEADAVIVCGGLGPTHDDVTREAIADVMGVELSPTSAVADVIRSCSPPGAGGWPTTTCARPTCLTGATVIPQTRGTAPGLICPVGDKVVYAVPGRAARDARHVERVMLPDLRRRAVSGRDRQPRAAHVGRERERAQRAARRRRSPGSTRRQSDVGVPGQRVGRAARSDSRPASRRGEAAARCSTSGRPRSAVRARAAGVRGRRRLDGVRRPRPAARPGPDARAGRVGDRRSRGRAADRDRGRERRAAGLDRVVRERGQVRTARRAGGPGRQRGRGGRDGRRRAAYSAPTSGWRSPVWPGPAEQDGMPSGRCSSAVAVTGGRSTATCGCPASASRCGSSP